MPIRSAATRTVNSDIGAGTSKIDSNHIADMEALLSSDGMALPSKIMLRFALAKECEDLDLNARAFDHVNAGCALQRRAISYDANADVAEIERIADRFFAAGYKGHRFQKYDSPNPDKDSGYYRLSWTDSVLGLVTSDKLSSWEHYLFAVEPPIKN